MLIEYNPKYHTPARNIRLLRKKYYLSRRALAKLVGISEVHLKHIEAEENAPVFDSAVFSRLMQVFPIPEGKDICSPDLFD